MPGDYSQLINNYCYNNKPIPDIITPNKNKKVLIIFSVIFFICSLIVSGLTGY